MAILRNRSILHFCWLRNHSPCFLAAEPWLWENALALSLAAAGASHLEHPATWHPREKAETWEQGADFFSPVKKEMRNSSLGWKAEVGASAWQHCSENQSEGLNSLLYGFLRPLGLGGFFLHYQIFTAPGFCQQCVIRKQEVLPEDLLEGKRKKEGSFFNFMSENEQLIRSAYLMYLQLFLHNSSLALEANTWLINSVVFKRFPFLDTSWHFLNYLQWDTAACITTLLKA